MSRIAEYLYKFHNTPKKVFLKHVYYKLRVYVLYQLYHIHDAMFDTRWNYCEAKATGIPLPFCVEKLDVEKLDVQTVMEAWRMYRSHRFDLLGSGWVKNGFINNAQGLEGYSFDSIVLDTDAQGEFLSKVMNKRNVSKSKKIWQMISGSYEGIDWQKDYKSGYRWGADKWYRPQGNAKEIGGDIKMPWELARLQHFPRLAIFAIKMPEKKQDIFREYCNQMLDFISQNPPRMGVNYMCTMDVGIRTANIALSYSLFKNMGMEFEPSIEHTIINFVFEQCNHIRRNLEWSDILTSNHYFADIAGLLYGSAILPDCKRKHEWLIFAVDQVKHEIIKQFYEEGTNTEGSTAYHRLTGEMAVYSAALIHCLAKQGVCEDVSKRIYNILYGAGKFTHDITRPDGSFTQIGDNDSGLFFKLSFTGKVITAKEAVRKYHNLSAYIPENVDEVYVDENLNDGRPFVAAVCGMVEKPEFQAERSVYPLEHSLVRMLMQDEHIEAKLCKTEVRAEGKFDRNLASHHAINCIKSKSNYLTEDLERIAYPMFGIYIYKSPALYLCINATDNGQKGNAGHAHNDKLSFELFMDGECIYQDSGTYVYTAIPEERNRFRSVRMHNTIYVGKEQNEYINLFAMKSKTACSCLAWTENVCVVKVTYDDVLHVRKFILYRDRVEVEDFCNKSFEENFLQGEVTVGYGKKVYS